MLRKLIQLLLPAILLCAVVSAQTPDFKFQETVDAAYEAYVDSMEQEFTAQIDTVDDVAVMKARMGMILVSIAQIQILGTHFGDDMQVVVDDFISQEDTLYKIMDSLISINDTSDFPAFLASIRTHFEDPLYTRIQDMSDGIGRSIQRDQDSMMTLVDDYGTAMQDYFITMEDNINALTAGTSFVDFSYQIGTDSSITLDTAVLQQLDDVLTYFGDIETSLGDAISAVETATQHSDSSVAKLQEAVGHLNVAVDSLEAMFTIEVLDSMGLDISGFTTEARRVLDDADSVLAGQEFEIPDDSTKTIRPLAILENLDTQPNEVLEAFLEIYRTDQPETVTIRGLFPKGLPQAWLDGLEENMVMDLAADSAQVDSYFTAKEAEYNTILNTDPLNGEANLGLAIIKTYRLVINHKDEIEEIVDLLDQGLVDSLTAEYPDWNALDYTAETNDIRDHFALAEADDGMLFTLITKDSWDSLIPPSFDIRSEDDIWPGYIPNEFVMLGSELVDGLVMVRNEIAQGVEEFWDSLRTMVDLDLDPSVLDFSQTVHDTEVVDILISSNPNFLNLTAKGIQELTDLRADIRNQMAQYVDVTAELRLLLHAVADREADLGVNGTEFRTIADELDSMANVIKVDFDFPDSTIIIDSERVNLSAWFDDPPTYMIWRIRSFVDEDTTTDNTLGGLFPDRGGSVGMLPQPGQIVYNLKVHEIGPNPALDYFTIGVDLPHLSEVGVKIYDSHGSLVKSVDEGQKWTGRYVFRYSLSDLKPGQYFVTLSVNGKESTRRLLLLK